jgi:SAM-dependent methyltransferase
MTERQDNPIVIAPEGLPPHEAEDAKRWYLNSEAQPFDYAAGVPAYARLVAECVASLGPRSVLEFGCNAGRNLDLIRRLLPQARLAGVDLNPLAIAKGAELFGLALILGDERTLAGFADAEFDVSLTISALDHMPDARAVARELVRITGHRLVLLEIAGEPEGRVAKMIDEHGRLVDGYPYSYFHDYRRRFERELGCPCLVDVYLPMARGNLLDFYRLYVFATRQRPQSGESCLRRLELEPLPAGEGTASGV